MFTKTVTGLLGVSSAGLSSNQILWRLRNSGLRFGVEDILQTLADLVDSGEVVMLETGRWRLATFQHGRQDGKREGGREPANTPPVDLVLSAVTAIVSRRLSPEVAPPSPLETSGPGQTPADADWRKLLAYYAATQRLDPRGKVDERADQHAVSWQLFRADGRWWDLGELLFAIEGLPSTFREGLMRRPEAVCSVGYLRARRQPTPATNCSISSAVGGVSLVAPDAGGVNVVGESQVIFGPLTPALGAQSAVPRAAQG
jgi:hypothetical protein